MLNKAMSFLTLNLSEPCTSNNLFEYSIAFEVAKYAYIDVIKTKI